MNELLGTIIRLTEEGAKAPGCTLPVGMLAPCPASGVPDGWELVRPGDLRRRALDELTDLGQAMGDYDPVQASIEAFVEMRVEGNS
jgi:hypothetical protein